MGKIERKNAKFFDGKMNRNWENWQMTFFVWLRCCLHNQLFISITSPWVYGRWIKGCRQPAKLINNSYRNGISSHHTRWDKRVLPTLIASEQGRIVPELVKMFYLHIQRIFLGSYLFCIPHLENFYKMWLLQFWSYADFEYNIFCVTELRVWKGSMQNSSKLKNEGAISIF